MSVAAEGDILDGPARQPTPRFRARRQAILASAVEVLNRKGLRGMTLGEVAGRLDLVPTGVTYYFRDKEALASACLLEAIERHDALIEKAAVQTAPRARVEGLVRGFFALRQAVAVGEVPGVAAFNELRVVNSAPVNAAYVEMFRGVRRLLDGPGIVRMTAQHRNARAHLLLSELAWAAVWLREFEAVDHGRAADRAVSILSEGLAAPVGPWPAPRALDLSDAGDADADAASELFLRAATKLINAQGYHGASVERISAELKVSKGAFYHHNETKDELVLACFQRTFDTVWRAIRAAEAAGGSALEVLVSLSAALVGCQLRGAAPLLRASARTTLPESLQPLVMAMFDRLSLRLASILSDGVADGSIRAIDVNVGAQLITGLINAAADLQFWTPGLTAEAATDHFVRPLFQGLLSEPPP